MITHYRFHASKANWNWNWNWKYMRERGKGISGKSSLLCKAFKSINLLPTSRLHWWSHWAHKYLLALPPAWRGELNLEPVGFSNCQVCLQSNLALIQQVLRESPSVGNLKLHSHSLSMVLMVCDDSLQLQSVLGWADNRQKIDTMGQIGRGESHSAANSHNSGGFNLIWLEVDFSKMPHGSPPKLTSWIFYRASMSTSILIPKWCSGQLHGGGVSLSV